MSKSFILFGSITALLFSLFVDSSGAQIYWRSINGESDSIARVSHIARLIDRISTRYTVDSVVSPASLNSIPGSMAMAEDGSVFIGTGAGILRFTSRFSSPVNVLARRANCLTVLGSKLFAATDSGLFVSSDNGNSWIKPSYVGNSSLRFVANDGLLVYASTDSILYRSTNSGQTWQARSLPDFGTRPNFLGAACGHLVIQFYGQIYSSTDGGDSFRLQEIRGATVNDLLCDDSLTYGLTSYAQVFVLDTAQYLWVDTNYAASRAAFDVEHRTLVGIVDVYVVISTNRAKSWRVKFGDYDNRPRSVVAGHSGVAWVALEHSAIASTDGGRTWLPVGPLLRVDSIAHYDTVWKSDTTYTTDTLRTHTLMSNRAVRAMVVIHGSELVCATDIGIVRSSDKGLHWQLSNRGMRDSNLVAIASNGTKLYAATAAMLYRSTDFGYTWDSLAKGWTTQSIKCLLAGASYLIAGTTAGMYRTVDDGATWNGLQIALLGNSPINGIIQASQSTLYFWTSGGVLRSHDAGSTAEFVTTADGPLVRNVAAQAGLVAYCRELGYLYLSTNEGSAWTLSNSRDNLYRVGISPKGAILLQGNGFLRLDTLGAVEKTYSDPWRGFFTDFAFDSTDGQYASLDKNGVLYHNDQEAGVQEGDKTTSELAVYPNPSTGIVTIEAPSASIQSVTVLNLLGEAVLQATNLGQDARATRVDLSKLPAGTYFLRIETPGETVMRKVVLN